MLECQLVNTVWDFYSEMVTVTKKIVLKVSKSRDLLTFSDREKFETEVKNLQKKFEITRAIYSNSERSEQFLVTECLFSRSNKLKRL